MSLKKGLIYFLVFSTLNLVFLLGGVLKTTFAEEATEVPIPEGYEKGRECPPAPEGDISICGKVRNIQQRSKDDVYYTGDPIEGVFIATYLGKEQSQLKDPSTFVWTNADGEYWINIHKYSGMAVTNYLAFFCKTEKQLYLEDLYEIKTDIKDVTVFDVGVTCKSATPDLDLEPKPTLGFIDRNGFLQCGEETMDWEFSSEKVTASNTFNISMVDVDDTYAGNVFDPTNVDPGADVPADQAQLAKVSPEGRHKTERAGDTNGTTSYNTMNLTGYDPAKVYKYGQAKPETVPACSTIELANETVTGGKMNSYTAGGPALGLAPPFVYRDMDSIIDSSLKAATKVCTDEGGNVKTLADFELGDPDYPYQLLFQLMSDKDLREELAHSELKYKGLSDSGYNDAIVDPEEDCREEEFAEPDSQGNKPFRACSDTRHPVVSQALRFAGTFDDIYVADEVLLSPFDTNDESNPELQKPRGIYRVGIPRVLCGCSTIEGGECETPTPSLPLSSSNKLISGYKVTTESMSAAELDSFYADPDIEFAYTNFFQQLLAVFKVWAGNLLDAIYGGDECVSRNDGDYEIVNSCSEGPPICEEFEECVNSTTGEPCVKGEPTCVCNTYFKKYTFTYQGGSCDGDVTFPLVAVADVKNEPGDEIRTSAEYMYKTFGSPFATVQYTVGSIDYADQSVTDASNNAAGEAAPFVKKNGTNSGVTYGDMVRFITQPDPKDSADLINPKEYPHTSTDVDFGECDGSLFEKIEGVPSPDSLYIDGVTQFNSAYLQKLAENPLDMEAYEYAQQRTGVPCEILAGIHWIEGSSNQYQSLHDGHTIDPSQLNEDAKTAADILKSKEAMAPWISKPFAQWTFQEFTTALSMYNGGGNSQCWDPTTPYADIPGNCPAPYWGEDDMYPMHWIDAKHAVMYLKYCADHTLCSPMPPWQKNGAWVTAILLHEKIKAGL